MAAFRASLATAALLLGWPTSAGGLVAAAAAAAAVAPSVTVSSTDTIVLVGGGALGSARTPWELNVSRSSCLATAAWAGPGGGGMRRVGSPVPLLSLYNRVADSRRTNLSPCVQVELLQAPGGGGGSEEPGENSISAALPVPTTRLRVHAEHGAGSIDVELRQQAGALFFRLASLDSWSGADPVERHVAYGEFWHGILSNTTGAPVTMGRLQGPRGTPGTGEISAGFMTLSPRTYFRYVFYAEAGDELAFGFAGPASADVAALWIGVAAARNVPVLKNNNRFNSYVWADVSEANSAAIGQRAVGLGAQAVMLLGQGGHTAWHLSGSELVVNHSVFPAGINHTVEMLRTRFGLKTGLHMHPVSAVVHVSHMEYLPT